MEALTINRRIQKKDVPKLTKNDNEKKHIPLLHMIRDTSDMAYPNTTDDFKRNKHVQDVMSNMMLGMEVHIWSRMAANFSSLLPGLA